MFLRHHSGIKKNPDPILKKNPDPDTNYTLFSPNNLNAQAVSGAGPDKIFKS